MRETYSGKILALQDNEIFAFGSNPCGWNGNLKTKSGGAAYVALKNGWVIHNENMDNCLSKTGKSWGITTVSGPGQSLSRTPEEMCRSISLFYNFAESKPKWKFFVAYTNDNPQQTSINGYRTIDMAAFFMMCGKIPSNIIFEDKFYELMQEIGNSL